MTRTSHTTGRHDVEGGALQGVEILDRADAFQGREVDDTARHQVRVPIIEYGAAGEVERPAHVDVPDGEVAKVGAHLRRGR